MREKRKDVWKDLVPVQIIGTQRSGSNLLRVMLNQLQGVFAPHPPHILKTFEPIVSFYGDLSIEDNFRDLATDICHFVERNPVPWLNSQFDPMQIIDHAKERTLLGIYLAIHEVNAAANSARYWFNKSMRNVYFIDYFEKNGFKPYYIHLIRDGRDVALSFKKTIVGEKHIYHLARQWRDDQELSNYYVEKFGKSRAIRVKYEDLLHQPQQEIHRICELIGLEYSNNILKFYESQDSRITAASGEMWHNLSKPLMKNNFNKYKRELDPVETELFEKVAGKLLFEYGYTLENNTHTTPTNFPIDQIREFDHLNLILKKEFLKSVSEKDQQKRHEQDQLLKQIYEKKRILKSV
jgi:hypothetical protein